MDERTRAAALASAFVGYNADNELADKIMDIVRDAVAQAVKEHQEKIARMADAQEGLLRQLAEKHAEITRLREIADRYGTQRDEKAEVITLLKQQAVESEESMVIVGRTVASMAEEIARLTELVKLDAGTIRLREEEIARLKAEIDKVHTSNLMKALNVANEEIARLRAVVKRVHGNYQPACPLCQDHRHWTDEALRVPGRGTEYDTI